MKTDERQAFLKKKHPDIEFKTEKGGLIRLTFERNEYRAYQYNKTFEKWIAMGLGGLDPDVLKDHIQRRY